MATVDWLRRQEAPAGTFLQVRGALDVHRELLARDVAHEVVRLSGMVTTADELPQALGVEATSCLAVRCYSTDRGFVAVLVHAGVVPEPSAVLIALGAHTLRPATADEVNAATDYAAGLVSPLCLPSEVALLADAALQGTQVLYCPIGEGAVALGIRTRDLLEVTGAQVAALSSQPLPHPDARPWGGGARIIDLDTRGAVRRSPRRSVG